MTFPTRRPRPYLWLSAWVLGCGVAESGDTAEDPSTTGASSAADSSTDPSVDPSAPGSDGPSTGVADASSGGDPTSVGSDPTDADGSSEDTGAAPNQIPPRSHAQLLPWLQANNYGGWAAESGVHVSAGPHGDGVRTFVNDALLASLEAGGATHPLDAAVVKELYGGGEITGWAVMIKVADGGADGWYWYESIGAAVYADGTSVALCTGCHAAGDDYVLSPFPLQ